MNGGLIEGFAYYFHEDFANAKVNNGLYFGTAKRFDITPSGTHLMLLKVNQNFCHGVLNFSGNNTMEIDIFYAPTVTNNGTLVPITNFKTYSTNTATTQLYTAPTVSANGVKISENIIFGSGGRNAIGAAGGDLRKFILAPNATFLIRFLSIDPGGQAPPSGFYKGFLQFNFYETDYP